MMQAGLQNFMLMHTSQQEVKCLLTQMEQENSGLYSQS